MPIPPVVNADSENDPNSNNRIDRRRYLRELLVHHPLWKDSRFWEQALWQLIMDQLATIPNEIPWHDLSEDDRSQAVKRIHDVIFSQVMAIAHSMIELGCGKVRTKDFVYRVCVIHQLSEAQRHALIEHIRCMQELEQLQ